VSVHAYSPPLNSMRRFEVTAGGARLPEATGYDMRLIIMCSQGYASSLAAASLQDLGLRHATDLIGGFIAWAKAGLPVQPGRVGSPR
jgi:rhodanese-related sulfurtransferase